MEARMNAIQTGGDSRIVGIHGQILSARESAKVANAQREVRDHIRMERECRANMERLANAGQYDEARSFERDAEWHQNEALDWGCIAADLRAGEGGAGMTPATMAAMDAEIERQRIWARRARGLAA